MRQATWDNEGRVTLPGGQALVNVHSGVVCAGRPCSIHNPSNHCMVDFDQHFDGLMMWRMCPHTVMHPDPDAVWYFDSIDFNWQRHYDATPHATCDGCCDDDVHFERYRQDVAEYLEYRNELTEKYEEL